MLVLTNISYSHPNRDLLFSNINLTISKQNKIALVGNNGIGKSTLLKIMAGLLKPVTGQIQTGARPYYVPQHFGQFNDYTVAQAMAVEDKLNALHAILGGEVSENNFTVLDDDWAIGERCKEVLAHWQLGRIDLTQPIQTLSGGQKTKVFLAGMFIHQPEIVLLDEPSNHLDMQSRQVLYDFVTSTTATVILVSHDRKLLNLVGEVAELSKHGITVYGGNYDFYAEQKAIETNALNLGVKSKEKALRKAKEVERESIERQQKLDARGRKKQEKAGVPTIVLNTLKNNAEKSTARTRDIHAEKTGGLAQELQELRKELPDLGKMKFGFDNSSLHKGKILIKATNINVGYNGHLLWNQPLDFMITSGERISISGANGSGKTSLIKVFLGAIEPLQGMVQRAHSRSVYIDQDYSLIDNNLSVYDQVRQFNSTGLQEHEIKIRLSWFLFTMKDWDKPCIALSGGEKMRLMLCCMTILDQAPDIIILDEPTNNLDIQNIEILTAAINDYQGTLLVISHDEYFLQQVNVQRVIFLH